MLVSINQLGEFLELRVAPLISPAKKEGDVHGQYEASICKLAMVQSRDALVHVFNVEVMFHCLTALFIEVQSSQIMLSATIRSRPYVVIAVERSDSRDSPKHGDRILNVDNGGCPTSLFAHDKTPLSFLQAYS